ncbi:radical SAM protein [Streptomyces sp. NBC_00564]|uniref:radical SAM protein n=1 Tax=Streptomyces sp. NBC_00564 TaxID=2903663 RepID=UPI00352BE99F|nr:radical SAM protein [Streptomyces sp. NBC_00564]
MNELDDSQNLLSKEHGKEDVQIEAPRAAFSRQDALASLRDLDPAYPEPDECRILAAPENNHLLEYVTSDAFTHVFPGDRTLDGPEEFFADLDAELRAAGSLHLWPYLPLCAYRCHYCQFPLLIVNPGTERAATSARRWVDANIAEARLWLDAVPALREVPVREFCLFGGTPTVFPLSEIERLMDFYADNFLFDPAVTSLRAEGSPDTLDEEMIIGLRRLGFDKLTYGIQTFDDDLLALANRRHTGQQAEDALRFARKHGFARVDADLVWGLPGQDVDAYLSDVRRMIDLDFSTVVMTKLHLRSFASVDTAIGHVSAAVWESVEVRERIAASGRSWPMLGRQYQMRAGAVQALNAAGYAEHPTTYFPQKEIGAPIWRSLNLDQDKQVPNLGIGLGGYTWSSHSEGNITSDPREYLDAVSAGRLPLTAITALSEPGRETRSVRMAMSTCQPLREEIHQKRFPGSSLFSERWLPVFERLRDRGLAEIDRAAGEIRLTTPGQSLVEAIINTEIK